MCNKAVYLSSRKATFDITKNVKLYNDQQLFTNLTLHFVYELLQLVDLGAPVIVRLHADP